MIGIFCPKNNPQDVDQLLLAVVQGEQNKAEEMIKQNPKLLFTSGSVTDYSDRSFENITAFQYAIWALDWNMWTMMYWNCSDEDKSELAKQLKDLEENGLSGAGVKHGSYYAADSEDISKNELTIAHVNFMEKYVVERKADNSKINWTEVDALWLKVGLAQKTLPAHVANWFCQNNLSFHQEELEVKQLLLESTLDRSLKSSDGKFWFDSKLGGAFAFLKSNQFNILISYPSPGSRHRQRTFPFNYLLPCGGPESRYFIYHFYVEKDQQAFESIIETGFSKRDELKTALDPQLQLSIR